MLIELLDHHDGTWTPRVTGLGRVLEPEPSKRRMTYLKAVAWAWQAQKRLGDEVVPGGPSVMPKPARRTKPTPCAPGSCELCDDRRDMQWAYTQEDHA